MRRYVSVIFLFTLACCGENNNVAPAGQVRALDDGIKTSISKEDLTDPLAYFERIDTILAKAPAGDLDGGGPDARAAFLKQAFENEIGATFLMPIACTDQQGQRHLRFDPHTKAVTVNLVDIDERLREKFQIMSNRIDNLIRVIHNNWGTAIINVKSFKVDFEEIYKSDIDNFGSESAIAAAITLPSDRIVAISNNPLSYIKPQIGVGIAETNLSATLAGLAVLSGEDIGKPDTTTLEMVADVLNAAAEGRGPAGWHKRVPYSGGDPVCVIGQFRFVDPVPEGVYAYVDHPDRADFSTSLKAWYLVEKPSLELLSLEQLMEE
ncbi:MAG: hypothetical protein KJZ64_09490 [Sphingomonadaceae bacterium]|nr:hypothetical protein [Sphingomonadaceae bacterium]